MKNRNLAYLLFIIACVAMINLVIKRSSEPAARPSKSPKPKIEVEIETFLEATSLGGPALLETKVQITMSHAKSAFVYFNGTTPLTDISLLLDNQFFYFQGKSATRLVDLDFQALEGDRLVWEVSLRDYKIEKSPEFLSALSNDANPTIFLEVPIRAKGSHDFQRLRTSCPAKFTEAALPRSES